MIYENYGMHRIFRNKYGSGWQAMIRPPNSEIPIPGPFNEDPTSYKSVIAEAKRWIDQGKI